MIRWEDHTWGRSTRQSAIRDVLIGRISVLTQPISFQMAVITGHWITAAIHDRMKIGHGAIGAAASGTSVCWENVVNRFHYLCFHCNNLISLGLALESSSTSVSSDFIVLCKCSLKIILTLLYLAWWDWPFIWQTDQLLSFSAWHCRLGHLTCRNRPRYDL